MIHPGCNAVVGLLAVAVITALIAHDKAGNAVDRLADWQIRPTPGSANGFRSGAYRDSSHRSWSVDVRDALPSPSFPQAIVHTTVPGDDRAVTGNCLPSVTYMSTGRYERLGCHS